jgi:hypothetical protein
VAAGFDPAAFWGLTPRVYLVQMRGARKRAEAEARADRVLAYNTAALQRAKKLPRASEFIGGDKPKVTGKAALDALRAHAARLPKRSWDEWRRHSSAR